MKAGSNLTHDKLSAGVEKLRVEIRKLKSEREKLEDAPRAKVEALARMRRWVDEVMAPGGEISVDAFISSYEPQSASERIALRRTADGPSELIGRAGIDSTICWLFGNMVKERLAAAIDAYYAERATEGVKTTERDSQLEEMNERLLKLEIEEERLICSGEEAGIFILRRADVDPRALAAVI